MKPFHRDAITIPAEPAARKRLVEVLVSHPVWKGEDSNGDFSECVDIDFLPYVNPATGIVDMDDDKNTALVVRLEAGAEQQHDVRLDFIGPSIEEALLALAARILFYFDETGRDRGINLLGCHHLEYDEDDYCVRCGLLRNHWNFWVAGKGTTLSHPLMELCHSSKTSAAKAG